jgi:hypothetical protein
VFDKTGTLTAREAYDLAFTGVPLTRRSACSLGRWPVTARTR